VVVVAVIVLSQVNDYAADALNAFPKDIFMRAQYIIIAFI
jgi:hypothetical protein